MGIENEIKDYNITRSLDKNAFALSAILTEALFYQQPDGSLVPDLVKDYKREGKLWTFKLRPSRFSNGKPLRCEDIRSNIEDARASPRPVRGRLRDIHSLRCRREELLIETKENAPQFIYRMGHLIRIYERASLKEKIPIGSGPYVISNKTGKDLVLIPNPYSSHLPHYKELRIRTLRDPWLRDLALMSGNVDFLMESFSLNRLNSYQSRKELKLYRNPSQMLFYLVLKKDLFSVEQRNYLRDVLSTENVVENYWGSQVEGAQSLFRDSSVNSLLKATSISMPKANSALKPFQIELSVVADESQLSFLRLMAKSLAKHGITLKLRPLEFAAYMKRLNNKNFESYFFYVDTSHAQNLEALLHSRGNRLGIQDPLLDTYFHALAQSESPRDLKLWTNKIDQRVNEEAYIIPLYRPYREAVTTAQLTLQHTAEGFWRDFLRSHKSGNSLYNGGHE